MTSIDLEAMKAAFLAKGGAVERVPEGRAYGIDPEADKADRKARRQFERDVLDGMEQASERRMEMVRDAAHIGGRSAAIDAMRDHDDNLARWAR